MSDIPREYVEALIRASGMSLHLGMPREAVIEQMTKFANLLRDETLEAAKPGGMLLAINTLRAALAEATIKQSLTVEPVAYVTGYSKGYATVKPVDPCLLMCVGMALYRSPPKREPLTDEEITRLWVEAEPGPEAFARAIERAHGIGDEE